MNKLPISEQARHIWIEQDKLNTVCSLDGKGTIDRFNTRTTEETEKLKFNYFLALHDEVAELINNFIWKHWAKEARQGLRFKLINQDLTATGEGTAQNIAVELIDIVFFTVSLLHLDAEKNQKIWTEIWGNPETWINSLVRVNNNLPENERDLRGTTRLLSAANNEFLLLTLTQFETAVAAQKNSAAILYLVEMFSAAGIGPDKAFELYNQKLQINYARVQRGRLQVNDTKAHTENETVGK